MIAIMLKYVNGKMADVIRHNVLNFMVNKLVIKCRIVLGLIKKDANHIIVVKI